MVLYKSIKDEHGGLPFGREESEFFEKFIPEAESMYNINSKMYIGLIMFTIHCNTEAELKMCSDLCVDFLTNKTEGQPAKIFEPEGFGVGIYRQEENKRYSVYCRNFK